ncbi:MAG: hypothetical protein WC788_00015 [Candidatus Paceibacterota bacterium]
MLIRKNLNKKRDLLIVMVFILLAVLALTVAYKDKIYKSGIVDIMIEKMGKYSRDFDKLF